jgi:hypothetical protein
LAALIPWIDVTQPVGIEGYYERLMTPPSDNEWDILNRERQVLRLDTGEYTRVDTQLTAAADVVGGLNLDDVVLLADESRLYRVVESAQGSVLTAGQWQCTATIRLVAF